MEYVAVGNNLLLALLRLVGLPHVRARLHEAPRGYPISRSPSGFGVKLIADPAMTPEMNLRVYHPRDEEPPFEIDDFSGLGGYPTLPHGHDLFPIYGDKTFDDFPLRYDLAV